MKKRLRPRGASMVEYALLLVAVLLVAAYAYRRLGGIVSESARKAGQVLTL